MIQKLFKVFSEKNKTQTSFRMLAHILAILKHGRAGSLKSEQKFIVPTLKTKANYEPTPSQLLFHASPPLSFRDVYHFLSLLAF